MGIQDFQLQTPFTDEEKTKLSSVSQSAEPNPSQVSSEEKTNGTNTSLRSFSPKDVADMAGLHGSGGGTDSNAIHKNVASEISTLTEKTTLVDNDLFIIEDSADSNNKKKVKVSNLPSGGSSILRYQASSTENEEVEVMATGSGITYNRTGTSGTFTIPGGVRLLSARLRLPMGTIGGFTFTIIYGTNGNNDGNTSFANTFPPISQVWREDSGAQVAVASNLAAGFDRLQLTSLAAGQSNIVRLQW